MRKYKFIISGGGTGGHIYPAIAIANNLKQTYNSIDILFVGACGRMEMKKVPQNGYKIIGLWISGIKRKFDISNLLVPFKIIHSLIKSCVILYSFRPDFVIGTGGFASGPIVFIASLFKVPTLIQEQNSFPGLTNRILSKKVDLISVAYDNMDKFFPQKKIIFTGNPVRLEIQNLEKSTEKENFIKDRRKKLLIIGGSLGSREINNFISKNIQFFMKMDIYLIWQCGNYYYEDYKDYKSKNVDVIPYISDMAQAYKSADIIVTRAGASVISELCIVGKPVIFIPSPNLAEDHQTKNANLMATRGAALMVNEFELKKEFFKVFKKVFNDNDLSRNLSKKIKSMAKPNATNEIVKNINLVLNED